MGAGGLLMARARVYRHDVRCAHCGSNWCVKDGKANGKQTYLCKDCYHRFSPEASRHVYPDHLKEQAVGMYIEGMNLSAISRTTEVKLGTVYSWIKKKLSGP